MHLTFAATYSGNIHLYAVDWDSLGRRETITVNDGSGDRTANISGDFSQGAWVNVPINVAAGGSLTVTVNPRSELATIRSAISLGARPV